MKSYTSIPGFMANSYKHYPQSEMIKLISEQPMEFQPGEKWNYNNSAYYLLGVIIEKASGEDYDTYLQKKIFTPLGMTSTRQNNRVIIVKNRAVGYTRSGGETRNAPFVDPSQPYSAGALISTVKDLAKWDAALYTDKLLKTSTLDQMWTPTRLNDGKTQDYGFGWTLNKTNGHRAVSHGGGIPGFSTYIARYPDDKLTVVVLTNLDSGNADRIARNIASVYVPDLAPKPAVAAGKGEDKDPQITEMLRKLVVSTAEGKADEGLFTPEARTAIFPDKAREAGEFLKTLGALQSVEPLEQAKNGEDRHYKYRLSFASAKLLCNLTLNKEGKISGITMMPE
jgi:hypothetical protein